MYHGVHSDPKKAGDYVITPQALEQDLSLIHILPAVLPGPEY